MDSPAFLLSGPTRKQNSYPLLCGAIGTISAGLILYSQTGAFVWDEGFHLLAAQLIAKGAKPYLDFCFPQTPLNAYWNAIWVHLFGATWRIPHFFAAFFVSAAMFLAADFVYRHFPIPRWRFSCALVTACSIGFSTIVFQFGPTSQAYGICLLLTVAAFRLTITAVAHRSPLISSLAGLGAGAAAASSLLSAPVALVLLIWIFFYARGNRRLLQCVAFLIAVAIPFTPVLWLFAENPHVVFFNIVTYQMIYRRENWQGAGANDVDVLTSWLTSSEALFMGLLGMATLFFLRRKDDLKLTPEFLLAGWLSLALIVYLSTTHPTFARYYILAVPFIAIFASPGLYLAGSRLFGQYRPFWPAFAIIALFALSLARFLFDNREATTWHDYEIMAQKVEQVTPTSAPLYAQELVYFLTSRKPPSGMEFSYAQQLHLPPAEARALHIVPESELDKRLKASQFSTVQICDDEKAEALGLSKLYAKKAEFEDCAVFWDRIFNATTATSKHK